MEQMKTETCAGTQPQAGLENAIEASCRSRSGGPNAGDSRADPLQQRRRTARSATKEPAAQRSAQRSRVRTRTRPSYNTTGARTNAARKQNAGAHDTTIDRASPGDSGSFGRISEPAASSSEAGKRRRRERGTAGCPSAATDSSGTSASTAASRRRRRRSAVTGAGGAAGSSSGSSIAVLRARGAQRKCLGACTWTCEANMAEDGRTPAALTASAESKTGVLIHKGPLSGNQVTERGAAGSAVASRRSHRAMMA